MRKLGLIGVGKLGLPYALCFAAAGVHVRASSYKHEYIENLKNGKFTSTEPGVNELYLQNKNIQYVSDNHLVIEHADMIYVMVATPSKEDGTYDISAIWDVVEDFKTFKKDLHGKILIVGSTVNPGDCELFQQSLQQLGVQVVYCPTFVAQGSVIKDIKDPHTLSIGTSDPDTFERCKDLFSLLTPSDTPIYNLHTTSAEILKLAGNCRATMEIAFFNLVGQIMLAAGMKQDIEKANQYLGFIKKNAKWKFGYGYGGPCYPRDNRAFVSYSKNIGVSYVLGSVVDQANGDHLQFLYHYFKNDNQKQMPYYFDYVSYKPDVALLEESQPLALAELFLSDGHKVFIKPSTFLTDEIKYHLKTSYGNLIDFATTHELQNQKIDVYPVDFAL